MYGNGPLQNDRKTSPILRQFFTVQVRFETQTLFAVLQTQKPRPCLLFYRHRNPDPVCYSTDTETQTLFAILQTQKPRPCLLFYRHRNPDPVCCSTDTDNHFQCLNVLQTSTNLRHPQFMHMLEACAELRYVSPLWGRHIVFALSVCLSVRPSVTLRFRSITRVPFDPEPSNFIGW